MRIKYLQHLKKLTVTQLKPTSTSVTPRRIIPFQKVFFKSENVSIDFRFFRTLPHNLWQGIPADPTLCEECRVVCNELPLVPPVQLQCQYQGRDHHCTVHRVELSEFYHSEKTGWCSVNSMQEISKYSARKQCDDGDINRQSKWPFLGKILWSFFLIIYK